MTQNQRLRAGAREAAPLDDDEEGKEGVVDAVEIEIVDQPEEGLAAPAPEEDKAADEAKKREDEIAALKKQVEDARSELENERRRAEAAVSREREQQSRADQLTAAEFASQKGFLEQAKAAEEAKLGEAKRKLTEALKNEDYEAAADAQADMVRASSAMGKYASDHQELDRREKTSKLAPRRETAPTAPATSSKAGDENDDPIEALRRQFDEVKAQREAERRRAEDADRLAKEHKAKADQLTTSEAANHKGLLEQAYAVEEAKLADAKRRYSSALADQNYDAAADAQADMVRSNGMMAQYATTYQEIERREKAPKPEPSADDQFEAAVSQMHPRVAEWARSHKEDVTNPDRQKLAHAADALAQAKGFAPGSDQYMQLIDEQMGYSTVVIAKPEVTTDPEEKPNGAAKPSKRTPAAPPSRTSGSGGGRQRVYLSEDDKRQAAGYGVDLETYAKWKLAAQGAPNTQGDDAMRPRLHFKAVS